MVTGGRHATFIGKARLTVTKGRASATTKGYRMQVEVIDAGPGSRRPDKYAMALYRHGKLVHRSTAVPAPLGRGSIQVTR